MPCSAGDTAAASSAGLPPLPDWNVARPYLTGAFILEVSAKQAAAGRESAEVLESYPPTVQETIRELPSWGSAVLSFMRTLCFFVLCCMRPSAPA